MTDRGPSGESPASASPQSGAGTEGTEVSGAGSERSDHGRVVPLIRGLQTSGSTGWERESDNPADPQDVAPPAPIAHDRDGGHGHAAGAGGWGQGDLPGEGLHAKVVTVSDGVIAGTRQDASGAALVGALTDAGFTVDDQRVIADGTDNVAAVLIELSDGFSGVIVSTGGTGFAPRDQTPEGTKRVIEREAPGLAEAMRLVSPLGRLSRGVVGIRGQAVICNTPGSPKGCVEQLNAIIDVLPHAIRLLADAPTAH